MELTLVGLQYSGKTTFVNVIAVSKLANEQSQRGPRLLPGGGSGRGSLWLCFTFRGDKEHDRRRRRSAGGRGAGSDGRGVVGVTGRLLTKAVM